MRRAVRRSSLLLSGAGSLQFFESPPVLLEFLPSLAKFPLRSEALVLVEFLNGLVNELLLV